MNYEEAYEAMNLGYVVDIGEKPLMIAHGKLRYLRGLSGNWCYLSDSPKIYLKNIGYDNYKINIYFSKENFNMMGKEYVPYEDKGDNIMEIIKHKQINMDCKISYIEGFIKALAERMDYFESGLIDTNNCLNRTHTKLYDKDESLSKRIDKIENIKKYKPSKSEYSLECKVYAIKDGTICSLGCRDEIIQDLKYADKMRNKEQE